MKSDLTNFSPKKPMFATGWSFNYDYAPRGVKRCVEEIRKLNLPQHDIEATLGGNTAKLLVFRKKT